MTILYLTGNMYLLPKTQECLFFYLIPTNMTQNVSLQDKRASTKQSPLSSPLYISFYKPSYNESISISLLHTSENLSKHKPCSAVNRGKGKREMEKF